MKRLRIVTVDRQIKCPYGQGYGQQGMIPLRECLMDAYTEGTVCSRVYAGGRCNVLTDELSKAGRTWNKVVEPKPDTPHKPEPVRLIVYKDTKDRIMALNVMTGERQAVDLTTGSRSQPKSLPNNLALLQRRGERRTVKGAWLYYPYYGWIGGGITMQSHLWCDCANCRFLQPKTSVNLQEKFAEEYSKSLPEDLQIYWNRYVWQYVYKNGPLLGLDQPLLDELKDAQQVLLEYYRNAKASDKKRRKRDWLQVKRLVRLMERKGAV